MSLALLAAASGGLALLLLAAFRPALACVLLAAAIPLTAGLGRGTVVPVLRANEAILLLVAAGVVLGRLPRRRPLVFNGLDLAVLAFCAGGVIIPWAVILLTHARADLQDWMTVLAPVQYLAVYLLFSRVEFSAPDLRLLLKVLMLVSVPVGLVAVAQLLDLGGVRALVGTYYPTAPQPSWDTVYRPASLLGFSSAVGAFGLLNFLLALALAATRHPGFSQSWLTVVMAVNLVGILATQTYAPIVALPLGTVAVLLVVRRVPWAQLVAAPPGLIASAIALWPIIGVRLQQQLASDGGGGMLQLPESLGTRLEYWQGFFVPALLKHGLWLGTGTLIPSEVPTPLTAFIDNGYLWQAFRAGLPGVALYLLLLGTVLATAWKARFVEDPTRRAVAAICVGVVASVVLLDTTSEYLAMTAVSQEFWMLAGLLTGLAVAVRPSAASVVELASPALGWWGRPAGWQGRPIGWRGRPIAVARRLPAVSRRPPPLGGRPPAGRQLPAIGRRPAPIGRRPPPLGWQLAPVSRRPHLGGLERPLAFARRFVPGRALVRSSLVVLVGVGLATLLGFAFQVASGRLLEPADYGRLTYALTVAGVASIMLTTAPVGLSRFLARHTDSRAQQESYYSNWLAVIAVVLGASLLGTAIVAPVIGLGGWLLAGLIANLLGATALATYREVQRGLGHFTLQSIFYVLANALQLAAILALGLSGWRSPTLFLAVFGLSGVAALLCVLPFSRNGPRIVAAAIDRARMKEVFRFLRPIMVQAVFWNLWFSGDLVLVQHFAGPRATGIYGAAKAIANGFQLIPGAVAFVFATQVARLHGSEVRGHLVRALAFTAGMIVPVGAAVVLVVTPLVVTVFGPEYRDAAAPLAVLIVGMVLYGLKTISGSFWVGIGHPIVGAVSSAAAMVTTLVAGLLLIPGRGAVGAAVAFSAGALAQLLVDAGVTLWAFGSRTPRVRPLGDRPVTEGALAAGRRPETGPRLDAAEPRGVLLLAEDVEPAAEDGYTTFVVELASVLAARRPLDRRFGHAAEEHRLLPLRLLDHTGRLVEAARSREGGGPGLVVYTARRPVALPVLLRARILRRLTRPAPSAMIAPQGCTVRSAWLLRRLAPDLLLLPTVEERDLARSMGVNTALVWDGQEPAGPEPWRETGERLLGLMDDLALLRGSPRPRWDRLRALAAKARRSYVARRDWWRRWRWGDRVAYEVREPRAVAASEAASVPAPPTLTTAGSDVVGLMAAPSEVVLGAAARLAGLGLEAAARHGPEDLIDRAFKQSWPLLHLRSEHLDALPESLWSRAAAYVQAGGTLYVDGLEPARQERLAAVCGFLRVAAPTVTGTPLMSWLSFPPERADFARELAGARLESPAGRTALSARDGWEALAHGGTPDGPLPVMVRRRLGRGTLVLSAASSELGGRLADAFAAGSLVAMPAVLPIMLLRAVYGSATWHPPATLANFSIDDPALRQDLLGLRWDLLLARARDHRFHTTIATVPRELAMADPAVVELIGRHRELLSACYHGCRHDSYEFYSPEATQTRYRPRSLPDQRRLLEEAVQFGLGFTRAQGLELDRVMVFPHGPGPEEIFWDLHRLGFLGTCNYCDKYPPSSRLPDDPDLGMRPGDLAWAGFPLLWRRHVGDGGYLLDLLLGRPLLSFAHTPSLGVDFGPFAELADRINQATRGGATWCGLDEVARHAYLQRRRPDGRWEVLMTTNEACLHNPDFEPRDVLVRRPDVPPASFLEVDGERGADSPTVTVPAHGTAVVRLVAGGVAPALVGRRRCSIFPAGPGARRGLLGG